MRDLQAVRYEVSVDKKFDSALRAVARLIRSRKSSEDIKSLNESIESILEEYREGPSKRSKDTWNGFQIHPERRKDPLLIAYSPDLHNPGSEGQGLPHERATMDAKDSLKYAKQLDLYVQNCRLNMLGRAVNIRTPGATS